LFFWHRLLVRLKLLEEHNYNLLNLILRHGLEVNHDGVAFVIYNFFSLKFFHLLLKLSFHFFRDVV